MNNSRRNFIKNLSLASISLPFLNIPFNPKFIAFNNDALNINIFSKHLQFLNFKEVGQIASELGYDGVDLTVRPKGHVLPKNVSKDLPKAIKEINKSGSQVKMITTRIQDINDPSDIEIIKTARASGIKYYRSDWFKYHDDKSMIESLDFYKKKIKQLAELNEKFNITGCYQNHSGKKVGASFWEIYKILEEVNPKYFGVQYDIRHAIAEGGKSWENGLKLLKNQIQTIVLKDFKWGIINGKWKIINVPIGEGMVNFNKYFKLLKSYGLNPPVSLHLEYPLGGAEKGKYHITIDKKIVFDAMAKDLKTIHALWEKA